MARLAAACAVLAALLSQPIEARAAPSVDDICHTLAQAAASNELPEEFLTRLIWQESRFDPNAVSPAGAQGIAQFMPQTAAMRGLTNAFEPLEALRESASYLRELRTTFHGNLGLAAAAYNAGPNQVEAWLAGRSALPFETQAYVRIVTGYPAEAWASRQPPRFESSAAPPSGPTPSSTTSSSTTSSSPAPSSTTPSGTTPSGTAQGARCVELAKLMAEERAQPRPDLTSSPAWGPWGVQLAGNWSEGRVLATYEQLRRRHADVLGDRLPLILRARRSDLPTFAVRVSEQNRADANALCAKLRAEGGACVVFRNPRN
ncbi:MAG: lytic transglycosylase domain-containing protein [Proteobacteria bacterium]|nr:lytic transglycosylase domain-containing protein [Pseudomonadota bacterium]